MKESVVAAGETAIFCAGAWLPDGLHMGVRIQSYRGKISAIEVDARPRAGDVVLEDDLLLPGFCDLHCHLEYDREIAWRGDFVDWLRAVVEYKDSRSVGEIIQALEVNMQSVVRAGTTTIVSTISDLEWLRKIRHQRFLNIFWAAELIDIEEELNVDNIYECLQSACSEKKNWSPALSPHAPYTASANCYAAAARIATEKQALLTTHLGESSAETMYFTRGECSFKRWLGEAKEYSSSPVVDLLNRGALPLACVVAHANELSDAELRALAAIDATVVHCPRTHAFFDRPSFDLERYQSAGLRVCLGTDSRLSGSRLSLRDELAFFWHKNPSLSTSTAMELVTAANGQALRGNCGVLAVDGAADFFTLRMDGCKVDESSFREVLCSPATVSKVWAAGEMLSDHGDY